MSHAGGALFCAVLVLGGCNDSGQSFAREISIKDWAEASCAATGGPAAEVCVYPGAAEVASEGQLVFSLELAGQGAKPGATVEIEFPSTRRGRMIGYLMSPPQTTDASAQGYVSACLSAVARSCTAEALPITAQSDAARVELPEGAQAGEFVRIELNARMRANAGKIRWKLQVDANADGRPEGTRGRSWLEGPEFAFEGAEAAYVVLTAPADVAVGEDFTLAAVAHDRFGNLARAGSVEAPVRLRGEDLDGLPESLAFETASISQTRKLVYRAPGLHAIRGEATALPVYTNYSFAHEGAPDVRRFFGDTHFHTGTITGHRWRSQSGGDHRAQYTEAEQAYTFAAEIARLDFASLAEHDLGHTRLGWEAAQLQTRVFGVREGFTTFRAYEWTPKDWTTNGVGAHQVVLYRGDTGNVFSAEAPGLGRVDALVKSLERQSVEASARGGDATFMLIPHPMGTRDLVKDGTHPIFQPGLLDIRYTHVTEFHSRHRLPVADREHHPQVYEGQGDAPESHTLQYAWSTSDEESGKPRWHLGVVGSSDNHLQMPGAPAYAANLRHAGSLAVLLARENSRDALWDALEQRRTYGTTGERIYVSMHIDGVDAELGSRIEHSGPRRIELAVGGTAPLEEVSVLRATPGHGFQIVWTATEFADGDALRASFVDEEPIAGDGEWIYYARVRQKPTGLTETEHGGVAITSPIWVRAPR